MRPFIILFSALLMFSAGVSAFSMAGIIKQAEVIKVNAVTAATNTAITVTTTIRGFAANDPYQIKKIDIPKATYMTRFKAGMGETGGLKGLMKRNAWYAAWLATMLAAGWAIDELTNQVTQTTSPTISNYFPPATVFNSCSIRNSGGSPLFGYNNVTLAQCSVGSGSVKNITVTGGYTYSNGYYIAPISYLQSSNPAVGTIRVSSSVEPIPNPSNVAPVTDDSLFDSLVSYMLQDPQAAAQAFMVPDPWPYPYPEIFPDTVPYIPGVTQSDQELLDLYAQGLLQSTNPNAAHYVSPEKLAEIAALAGQLQQGLNPEAVVDAANQAAQAPVTQAQLEEILKKQEAAEAKADAAAVTQAAAALAPATTALDELQDEKTELEDMITDAPTAQPPSTMPNIFKWTLPTGNCQPYPFRFTIQAGSAQADDNGAFCQTYNEVAHPLIFWFLNMLTAIYIFSIWSRTMTSVVGGR